MKPKQPDPTPKEIEKRAAEVREGWSEKTRRWRLEGKRIPVPYEFPRYRIVYDPKDPEVMIGMEPT